MTTQRKYVGARYVPLFMGEWDNTKTYEPLSIVYDNGFSYTSRTYVPTGIDIDNEVYWALTGEYASQIQELQSDVSTLEDIIPVSAFSSESTVKDYIESIGSNSVSEANSFSRLTSSKVMKPYARFIPSGSDVKTTGAAQGVLLFDHNNDQYMLLSMCNTDETVHIEIIDTRDVSIVYADDVSDLYHDANAFICNGDIYCFNAQDKSIISVDVQNISNPTFTVKGTISSSSPAYSFTTACYAFAYKDDKFIITNGVSNYVYNIDDLSYVEQAPSFDDTFYLNGACTDDDYIYLMCNFPNTVIVKDKESFDTVYNIPIGQRTLFYTYGEAEGICVKDGVIYTTGDYTLPNRTIVNVVKFDLKNGEPSFDYPVYNAWVNATVYVDNSVDLNAQINSSIGTSGNPFKYIEDASVSCPGHIKLNIVIIGEYPDVVTIPSNVNAIHGKDSYASIGGIILDRFGDVIIGAPLKVKRGVSLFSTHMTAIRVYNGYARIEKSITYETVNTDIADSNQLNVYLATGAKLVSDETYLSRVWAEQFTTIDCAYLMPPYMIRGKVNCPTFTYYNDNCFVEDHYQCKCGGTFKIENTTSTVSTGMMLIQKGTTLKLPIWCDALICNMADSEKVNEFIIPILSVKYNTSLTTLKLAGNTNVVITFTVKKVTNTTPNWSSYIEFTVTSIKLNGTENTFNIYARGVCIA